MINDAACGPRPEERQRASKSASSLAGNLIGSLTGNVASTADTRNKGLFVVTEWVMSVSLLMYALFAPHSIAITQGSYLLGLTAWGIQLAATRSFRLKRTPVDIALFGFFACCVVSSFFSYDPLVSIKGLKSPAFFLAFYFVSNKVRTIRFASFLALAMIVSCLVNAAYSGVMLANGRGLRIDSIRQDSPFAIDTIKIGDIILEADDEKVNSPGDLSRIIDARRGRLRLKLQRNEAIVEVSISRRALVEASGAGFDRIGVTTSPGRNFRITGFYSHYETYAEVLQLIAALAVGILIAYPKKRSLTAWGFTAVISILAVTLILTSTRAALAGLSVAVASMAIVSSRRRVLVTAMVSVLILLPLALAAVERSRGISVFDPEEGSTAYRLELWREGFGIVKDHPLLGIGKGSEGKLKESLRLYDDGRLPPGHFHSTPVQIAVWWGLLALLFYCSLMTILTAEIWRLITLLKTGSSWQASGIALGGLGAVMAFNVSSLAHFNFGDGEVVMAFWLLTGLAFAVRRIALEAPDAGLSEPTPAPPSPDSSHRSQLQEQVTASEPSVRAAKAKQN